MMTPRERPARAARSGGRHIVFCLCAGLPLFAFASALEVLRHANRFADRKFYDWSFLCEGDAPLKDINGLLLFPNTTIADVKPADIAFVVAGFGVPELEVPLLSEWLRKQAAAGKIVGGISNGAFVLAKARLLDGYGATVHFEDFAAFCALFPKVRPRYQRVLIDRKRMTCAGGAAALDLLLEIVREDLGNELSLRVARQMLLHDQSEPDQRTRDVMLTGAQHYSFRVQRALTLSDQSTQRKLNVGQLAERVGLSRRQLLRLLRRETGKSPGEILNQRRLERARSLVLHSHLPLVVVASAVGFSSQSHLTSAYKKFHGETPAAHRRKQQVRFDGEET
jgi:transcriptional regulator GlxA family with amidase domain